MTTSTNLSCPQAAQAYMDAKTAKVRTEIAAYIKAKADVSKRVRWSRLHAAVEAKDEARLRYYAATGAAKRDAANALKNPPKGAPKAKPAPKAKRQSAKARAKAAAVANVDPLGDAARAAIAAAKGAGLNPEQAAAFAAMYLEA